MYLATNLHADRGLGTLNSVNYQVIGTLIPWGTRVNISEEVRQPGDTSDASPDYFLKNLETNKRHIFFFHGKTKKYITPYSYFKRILTDDLEGLQKRIDQLSEIDKEGIERGRVIEGMSREGVTIALGNPPIFANQEQETATVWRYWFNRRGRFQLHFDENGKVENIEGFYRPRN